MAVYIAIVRNERDIGYTASFPDFPGLAAAASSLELLFAKARQKIGAHIEQLLESNHSLGVPKSAETINRGGALMLAAIELPDDVRTARIELAIPALALVRIDALAQRHGLTRAALFAAAVQRWEAQERVPLERRGENPDGPTLFDFANPLELRVSAIPANVEPPSKIESSNTEAVNTDDITAELERLLERESEPQSHGREVYRQSEADPKEK
jgi:predicted RNase H-like HicB family nuclease